jgi:hypothetical protein
MPFIVDRRAARAWVADDHIIRLEASPGALARARQHDGTDR